MIGGVVAAVLGFLVVAGLALYFWRRKKHRRDKEEQEYVNQVRKDFGRRLELEFEDDEAGNGQDVSIFGFLPR
jgi:LPXTG-motif cell wall-anchored protein